MKKEDLIALGIADDVCEKVLGLYKTAIDGNFIPKSHFNEANEENKSLKEAISERDKQLETLSKNSGDVETLKTQIAELQKSNAEAVKAHEAEMSKLKLDNAVEAFLLNSGAKNVKAVRSLLDESNFKLTEKGEVVGLNDSLSAVKASDPYLFNDELKADPQIKGFKPQNSENNNSKPDIANMTYSEYMAAMAEKN